MDPADRPETATGSRLYNVFELLSDHYGLRYWWPAESPFEMVVGAILTQNTAWTNVERALEALKQAGELHPAGLAAMPREQLEQRIRPAGFFRQKARYLQEFVGHMDRNHQGDLAAMLAGPGGLEQIRAELLGLPGVGPETADSILLYAGGWPTFVVDAYTRRLYSRLGLLRGNESYEAIRTLFMTHLPQLPALFNEYHALIVEQCKRYCRKQAPRCRACPLQTVCPRLSLA